MSLISLNPLEFFNLFSSPGNSLNLAIFVIMSLNPLEFVNLFSSPGNSLNFCRFCYNVPLKT